MQFRKASSDDPVRPVRYLILAVLALALAFAPIDPTTIERVYSNDLYLRLQPAVTFVSDLVPVALLDVLAMTLIVLWLLTAIRDLALRPRSWLVKAGGIAARSLGWAGGLYMAFLVMWGWNYHRVPLADRVEFDRSMVSPDAVSTLLTTTVARVNALYEPAHSEGWPPAPDPYGPLSEALASVERDLGVSSLSRPGHPKATLLDFYFRRAGVSGMIDPFFLETLVATDLLPVERPLVVAHEWAHLAGFADEGEANFVGWLACLRGTAAEQYSAWLFLYEETARAVKPVERASAAARLEEGPQSDLKAIADRLAQQVDARVASAGWKAYDRYLKMNDVKAGAASYSQVVQLVIGSRLGAQSMSIKSDSATEPE